MKPRGLFIVLLLTPFFSSNLHAAVIDPPEVDLDVTRVGETVTITGTVDSDGPYDFVVTAGGFPALTTHEDSEIDMEMEVPFHVTEITIEVTNAGGTVTKTYSIDI